jgi:hypothetical protein
MMTSNRRSEARPAARFAKRAAEPSRKWARFTPSGHHPVFGLKLESELSPCFLPVFCASKEQSKSLRANDNHFAFAE